MEFATLIPTCPMHVQRALKSDEEKNQQRLKYKWFFVSLANIVVLAKCLDERKKTWWKHIFEWILCDSWNVTVWIAFALLKLALAVVNEI